MSSGIGGRFSWAGTMCNSVTLGRERERKRGDAVQVGPLYPTHPGARTMRRRSDDIRSLALLSFLDTTVEAFSDASSSSQASFGGGSSLDLDDAGLSYDVIDTDAVRSVACDMTGTPSGDSIEDMEERIAGRSMGSTIEGNLYIVTGGPGDAHGRDDRCGSPHAHHTGRGRKLSSQVRKSKQGVSDVVDVDAVMEHVRIVTSLYIPLCMSRQGIVEHRGSFGSGHATKFKTNRMLGGRHASRGGDHPVVGTSAGSKKGHADDASDKMDGTLPVVRDVGVLSPFVDEARSGGAAPVMTLNDMPDETTLSIAPRREGEGHSEVTNVREPSVQTVRRDSFDNISEHRDVIGRRADSGADGDKGTGNGGDKPSFSSQQRSPLHIASILSHADGSSDSDELVSSSSDSFSVSSSLVEHDDSRMNFMGRAIPSSGRGGNGGARDSIDALGKYLPGASVRDALERVRLRKVEGGIDDSAVVRNCRMVNDEVAYSVPLESLVVKLTTEGDSTPARGRSTPGLQEHALSQLMASEDQSGQKEPRQQPLQQPYRGSAPYGSHGGVAIFKATDEFVASSDSLLSAGGDGEESGASEAMTPDATGDHDANGERRRREMPFPEAKGGQPGGMGDGSSSIGGVGHGVGVQDNDDRDELILKYAAPILPYVTGLCVWDALLDQVVYEPGWYIVSGYEPQKRTHNQLHVTLFHYHTSMVRHFIETTPQGYRDAARTGSSISRGFGLKRHATREWHHVNVVGWLVANERYGDFNIPRRLFCVVNDVEDIIGAVIRLGYQVNRRSSIASAAAHDISRPLAGVMGTVRESNDIVRELVWEDGDDPERMGSLRKRLQSNLKSVLKLVKHVAKRALWLSADGDDLERTGRVVYTLAEDVKTVVRLQQARAIAMGVSLRLYGGVSMGQSGQGNVGVARVCSAGVAYAQTLVVCNRSLLRHCLDHLVNNALKFSSAGGCVSVDYVFEEPAVRNSRGHSVPVTSMTVHDTASSLIDVGATGGARAAATASIAAAATAAAADPSCPLQTPDVGDYHGLSVAVGGLAMGDASRWIRRNSKKRTGSSQGGGGGNGNGDGDDDGGGGGGGSAADNLASDMVFGNAGDRTWPCAGSPLPSSVRSSQRDTRDGREQGETTSESRSSPLDEDDAIPMLTGTQSVSRLTAASGRGLLSIASASDRLRNVSTGSGIGSEWPDSHGWDHLGEPGALHRSATTKDRMVVKSFVPIWSTFETLERVHGSVGGGKVEHGTMQRGLLRLVVIDEGIGIQDCSRVFEQGFQERAGCSGAGFGMSVVATSIMSMGGSVCVQNNKSGHGCSVELVIPLLHEIG